MLRPITAQERIAARYIPAGYLIPNRDYESGIRGTAPGVVA